MSSLELIPVTNPDQYRKDKEPIRGNFEPILPIEGETLDKNRSVLDVICQFYGLTPDEIGGRVEEASQIPALEVTLTESGENGGWDITVREWDKPLPELIINVTVLDDVDPSLLPDLVNEAQERVEGLVYSLKEGPGSVRGEIIIYGGNLKKGIREKAVIFLDNSSSKEGSGGPHVEIMRLGLEIDKLITWQ